MEAVGGLEAEIAFDAADGEVHSRQPPRRGIAFLSEDADVAFGFPAIAIARGVGFYEFNRLHEHAARTAARVEDSAFPGREHFDEELDDATGRIELPAFLALGACELAEEIFIDAPDDVL